MNLFEGLNTEQCEAVAHMNGPMLVLAGAGSGKTRVIVHRIANLIKNGVYPENILAVTFTNKAASEMRERVEELVLESPTVSTFHAFGARFLRDEIKHISGYDKDFSIYDETDIERLLKECLHFFDIDTERMNASTVNKMIDDWKNSGLFPDDVSVYIENKYGRITEEQQLGIKIYRRYQSSLQQCNACDFGDLLMLPAFILKKQDFVRQSYQDKYQWLLVDEFQDTNEIQYELIKLLLGNNGNLFVVGDDDQLIYSWRGAVLSNILDFHKEFKEVKVIRLEQNYRSTGIILEAANIVVEKNISRHGKRLWTNQKGGTPVFKGCAEDDLKEAQFIAKTAKQYINDGHKATDIAVLYRLNARSRVLEKAFRNLNVPYKLIGGHKFFDRKEIKDILAYLRIAQNPCDLMAVKRVINTPSRKLGETAVGKIEIIMEEKKCNIMSAMMSSVSGDKLSKMATEGLKSFLNIVMFLSNKKDQLKLSELISELYEKSGYIKWLKDDDTEEAHQRLENLSELVNTVIEFENAQPEGKATLQNFLEYAALMSTTDATAQDAVSLMTVHASKGLEFPIVFVAGMEKGSFPMEKTTGPTDIEEERRLCYVAMTRAMNKLYMTYAQQKMTYGKIEKTSISDFMKDIPKTHCTWQRV